MGDGTMRKDGFTLIELLVVVAIIGVLAGILVPLGGKATASAKARKASMEAQGLVVAVNQFHDDHHYMPWAGKGAAVGNDKWAGTDDVDWMDILQGKNAKKKNYLSAKLNDDGMLLDPWGNPYQVGMDRDLDGQVLENLPGGKGRTTPCTVAVVSFGADGEYGTEDDITTFEWR
jgi:prepilin-type N-terminal cleavage/methylation domain-containing protein